jgi:hypothetical protein
MLLDDLGRVLATPMPRSRALRLLGATLFCAIFPRSAAAYNCAQQTCTQPIKCCLDFPGNPNASTPAACCTSNQFCCKGVTPMGGSWAYVTCCQSYEFCYTDPSIVKCEPCPTPLCGNVCCQTGQMCVNGTCCPGDRVCGNKCCPKGSLCASVTKGMKTGYFCTRGCPENRICGNVCCPPGSICSPEKTRSGTRQVCRIAGLPR